MKTITIKEHVYFSLLFDAIRAFVFLGGGDGDGWVVSPRYEEMADLFDFLNPGTSFKERLNQENMIIFVQGQETITFLSDRSKLPEWASDIIVELP